jgi:hypothetical protein
MDEINASKALESGAILCTGRYTGRMLRAIGDKRLARESESSSQRAGMKGCPKRALPIVLQSPLLVCDSFLLDAIHRAASSHVHVMQSLHGPGEANGFHSLDGGALLALGFLCEEAIREDLSDYMGLDGAQIVKKDTFLHESVLKRIAKKSNSKLGNVTNAGACEPLMHVPVKGPRPIPRPGFPEAFPFVRSGVGLRRRKSVTSLHVTNPSPLVKHLRRYYAGKGKEESPLADLPDFDPDADYSLETKKDGNPVVIRKRWPRNVFM